ncbi:helix-turn-helix domain-containing protein [Duganella sp. Root1480D1]|uniref:helix-turn-helix domain-containing protein n=1 Tax=Duganella sp. Root1480D1 TaxID=1736471 RepID=UPI00070CEA3F|nr:helix-turn-helix transcriptional regulator [Duganella sp. Root1480D1]KQZ32554.1 transcriptional regulator [Duganella sp. Root1480D1]
MQIATVWFLPMHFPARLIQLRKALNLTQQSLASAAELHVNQIRRYEAGTAQPTLEALIRLAKVLHVRLDDLVFGEGERGPDEDMALLFEAISEFTEDEKQTVRTVLSGMVLQHSARRWDSRSTTNNK